MLLTWSSLQARADLAACLAPIAEAGRIAVPARPWRALRAFARFFGPERRETRGNLVDQLAARAHVPLPSALEGIVSREALPDGRALLRDAQGRVFLATEEAPRFRELVFSPEGRRLQSTEHRNGPVSRGTEFPPSVRQRAVAFAEFLREQESIANLVPFHRAFRQEFRRHLSDPELARAVDQRIEVDVAGDRPGETVRVGFRRGSDGSVRLEAITPEQTMTVADEYGRTVGVDTALWTRLVATVPTAATTPTEPHVVKRVEDATKTRQRDRQGFGDTMAFAGRLFFFPHAMGVRGVRALLSERQTQGERILDVAFRVIVRDGVALAGYMLMMGTRTHPFYLFVPSDDEDDRKHFPIREFVGETSDFDKAPGDEKALLVYVDVVPPGDKLDLTTKHLFMLRHGGDPRAIYVKVENVKRIGEEVAKIRAEHGHVTHLEIIGHGNTFPSASTLEVGDELLTQDPAHVREVLIKRDAKRKNLAARFGVEPPKPRHPPDTRSIVSLDAMTPWKDVLAPGAKVRLTSCLVAKGPPGKEFLERFGGVLLDKGGDVAGSTLVISVGFDDWAPEHQAKRLEEIEEARRRDAERRRAQSAWSRFVAAQPQPIEHVMLPFFPLANIGMAVEHAFEPAAEPRLRLVRIPPRVSD